MSNCSILVRKKKYLLTFFYVEVWTKCIFLWHSPSRHTKFECFIHLQSTQRICLADSASDGVKSRTKIGLELLIKINDSGSTKETEETDDLV